MGLTLKKAETMILGTGRSKGFTLVEVMVSVTILSVCLALILSSFTKSIRAAELSRNYFKAGLLLEKNIFEIYNSEITPGRSSGVFNDPDSRFSWDTDVRESGEDSLKEIDLKVLWKEKNNEKDISVSGYI